ncbi:hypothetical protein A9G13_00430 [Gilliamella sp. wkB178]|uniref:hypothetical protein n=1 Tax=Gilliamella sp. wkB178 TaxID=3120259 RepID=UPI00080E28AB|nr:hypothetical protein [Gilliamella apicola]OCG10240.1 hypothetical protein A9G13_00430 [Gilliamella apicola]
MPKAFSEQPFNVFLLSTDINQNQPKSSAKSDTKPDTFGSIMACILKLALKPLFTMYVANYLYKNDNHLVWILLLQNGSFI